MLEHLLVRPLGGLCNRIGVIASAARLSEIHRIQCTILWDWGDFYSLFSHSPLISAAPPDAVNADPFYKITHLRPHEGGNPINWRVPVSTHQKVFVETRYTFCAAEEPASLTPKELKRWLPKPADLILSKVASFKKQYFGKTAGMHIRRTDHKPATLATPDQVCVGVAKQVIGMGYSVFLATDNQETEAMMRLHFGENIIVYPKNPSLKARWPRPEFILDETISDFVDLCLLAASKFVLGSRFSTYSLIAMLYNGSSACRWIGLGPAHNRSRIAGGSTGIKGKLKALVEKLPPPYIFLDVGANGGEDSIDLLRGIPQSTIYCFEPDPRAFARLEKNTRAVSDRCNIYNIALGGFDGKTRFYQSAGKDSVPKEWDKSGSVLPPKEHLAIKDVVFNDGIHIDQLTLDTWWKSINSPAIHLIWMDVQGAEGMIIRAGQNALSQTAFMFVESYQNEMFRGQMLRPEFLRALGPQWQVLGIYENNLLLANKSIT